MNFKKLNLGTRELGLSTVDITGVAFEEIPVRVNDRHHPKTDAPVYVTMDEKALKEFIRFYDNVLDGDENEGMGRAEYYTIIGIKPDGQDTFRDINEAKAERWHIDWHIPIQYEDSEYLVKIY